MFFRILLYLVKIIVFNLIDLKYNKAFLVEEMLYSWEVNLGTALNTIYKTNKWEVAINGQHMEAINNVEVQFIFL